MPSYSIRLGSFVRTAWSSAAVTAKTKTRVPTADFAGLVKATGAEYEFASDEYVLSCDATRTLPDLVLVLNALKADNTFDPVQYRVPASNYVASVSRGSSSVNCGSEGR